MNKFLALDQSSRITGYAVFENASIYDSNFEGSKGAKINPQTIFNKNIWFRKGQRN